MLALDPSLVLNTLNAADGWITSNMAIVPNLNGKVDAYAAGLTQLILDIFARHARTREGQLQVELAQLEYQLPRLAGRGKAMSQLGGGRVL